MASTIVSALPSPAAVLNRQGLVLAINAQWQDVNTQAETTSIGNSWLNLVEPGDRYVALSCFSEAAANARTSIELRLLTRSGSSRWHVVTLSPLTADTLLCVATDIDAIRRREALLETKASMQTQMLDISVDCIKLITPDGMVLHMNKSGCRALGCQKAHPLECLGWIFCPTMSARPVERPLKLRAIATLVVSRVEASFPGRRRSTGTIV
nr:PAS domain-containing protein [Devosia sp. MC521]